MFGSRKVSHEKRILQDPVSIATTVASQFIGSMISGDSGGGAVSTSQGQAAQQAADPFASYRPQFAQQLAQLMQTPSSVQQLPGFQAQMGLGMEALQRGLAKTGQTQSGQEQIALNQFGQAAQGQAFADQFSRLSQLSGASVAPYYGAQAGTQAGQAQQSAMGGYAGAIGTGLNQLFGGGGGSLSGLFGGGGGAVNYGGGGSWGTQAPSDVGSWASSTLGI